MTIHKAQGSESKNVIMFWPDKLLNSNLEAASDSDYEKKLIYTGITRAKEFLDLLITENTNG